MNRERMEVFGRLLGQLIGGRYPTQATFAEIARFDRNHLAKIVRGERTPPLELVDGWARLLGLTGEAVDDFCLAAELAHATPRLAKRVESLDTQSKQVAKLLARLHAGEDAVSRRQPHRRDGGGASSR